MTPGTIFELTISFFVSKKNLLNSNWVNIIVNTMSTKMNGVVILSQSLLTWQATPASTSPQASLFPRSPSPTWASRPTSSPPSVSLLASPHQASLPGLTGGANSASGSPPNPLPDKYLKPPEKAGGLDCLFGGCDEEGGGLFGGGSSLLSGNALFGGQAGNFLSQAEV